MVGPFVGKDPDWNDDDGNPMNVPSSGTYTFRGHGYGHGIGMGQYGAAGAARSGKTYWTILSHH